MGVDSAGTDVGREAQRDGDRQSTIQQEGDVIGDHELAAAGRGRGAELGNHRNARSGGRLE